MLFNLCKLVPRRNPHRHGQAGHELRVAVGLTSVKATAQWDELQRGLEAVLRVLVSSEYLSLVVFCGQF